MLEQQTFETEQAEAVEERDESTQVSKSGRIRIPLWGWVARAVMLVGLIVIVCYNLSVGLRYSDPLVVYSTLMPLHTLLIFSVAWLFFKSEAKGRLDDELVSVIIPVYNQQQMIENVVDSIFESSYGKIEVIAVNDGSTDGTRELLDELALRYPEMKVIHKENGGKRTAVAKGFYSSKGKYVVLIDSDSIVDKYAIEELVKTFTANPRVGGVVGNGKVWNSNENILTRCQSAWYDYSFNIHKSCESVFGAVLCCSGCLAAYRREAIAEYIPYWAESSIQYSDDRALTIYAIAEPWAKKELAPIQQRLMKSMAGYDDSEDRGLTAQTLVSWETLYVPTAVVYTEVPVTLKKYLRQQLRWKKGYLRSNFFVSAFFWSKNPLMALIFYLEFMTTFTSPIIIFTIFLYGPLFLKETMLPITFIAGQIIVGLAAGLDNKARDKDSENWKYNPLMNVFLSLFLTWLIVPAILTFREKKWLTR